MNKKQLIQRCLISDDAVETYPFGQDVYKDTCVMRHKSNDKWFAAIFYLDKKLYINVKTEPEIGALLRMQYPSITHGWHMNKKHWIKADPLETPPEVLDEIIKRINCTKVKKTQKLNLQLEMSMQHLNKDKVEILIKSIAQTVKEQRQNLCKSQRLLADEFAIQKSLLSRLENANNEPKIGSLWMVAEALGISASEFFKMVEEKLPEDFKLLD